MPQRKDASVRIQAIFAENLGQQLEEETAWIGASPQSEIDQQIITPDDLPPVEDPLAAPPKLDTAMRANSLSGQEDTPLAGLALAGRETGFKRALLAAYGGNATTEAAVARGLTWLARNQRRDGSWSLTGPYDNGSQVENRTAATAMALLAFQGAGNTHLEGQHKDQVARGWQWLSKQQDDEGDFWKGGTYNHRLYSQAQATIAVCELYGMSRDAALRSPAQLAINYAVKSQGRHGGWRYQPGDESDTSVTGWFVMALQSGLMAGLTVPSPTLDRISEYLDTVASDGGSLYSYRPGQAATPSMTAEALLCRQYLGWRRDDPRLVAGVAYLGKNPMEWDQQDVYYWYYACADAAPYGRRFVGHLELGHAPDAAGKPARPRQRRGQLVSRKRPVGHVRRPPLYHLSVYLHAGSLLPALANLLTRLWAALMTPPWTGPAEAGGPPRQSCRGSSGQHCLADASAR